MAADSLMRALQQKCSDMGVYWRASDAHGVDLTIEQATELLRNALGVEVEIKTPEVPVEPTPAMLEAFFGHNRFDGSWRKDYRDMLAAAPTAQAPSALHTAIRLVLEATPEQLPLALDALRDIWGGAAHAQSVPATGAQPLALDVIREAKQDGC